MIDIYRYYITNHGGGGGSRAKELRGLENPQNGLGRGKFQKGWGLEKRLGRVNLGEKVGRVLRKGRRVSK